MSKSKSQIRHTYVTKGTYAFIYSYYTYSTGEPLAPVHTIYCIHTYCTGENSGTCTYPIFSYIYTVLSYIVRGTSWYQPVIVVTPVVIRAHTTTNLHELKTALDAGRGGWSCKWPP